MQKINLNNFNFGVKLKFKKYLNFSNKNIKIF